MKRLRAPLAVVLGCALVVVANAWILGAALWNRAGGPRAQLRLTERELRMPPFREPEDTGIQLSLVTSDQPPPEVGFVAFRKNYQLPGPPLPWLDAAKLRELGFRTDVAPADPEAPELYRRAPPRRAYLVIEFDGPAWRSWLADRERAVNELRADVEKGSKSRQELADAETLLALDRVARSRLFPIDAGLDAADLLRRHPDRQQCVVMPGVVAPRVRQTEGRPPELIGEIRSLLVTEIHVPLRLHAPLKPLLPKVTEKQWNERRQNELKPAWPAASPPRYGATLAIGRSLDPWLVSVAPIEKESAE